jgi:hypothetical protein
MIHRIFFLKIDGMVLINFVISLITKLVLHFGIALMPLAFVD